MNTVRAPYLGSSDASLIYRATSAAPTTGGSATAVQGNLASVMKNWQIARPAPFAPATQRVVTHLVPVTP